MNEEINCATIYRSVWEGIEQLDADIGNELLRAIIGYQFTGELPPLSKTAAAIWTMISPLVEKNVKQKINGSKGGRPQSRPLQRRDDISDAYATYDNPIETDAKPDVDIVGEGLNPVGEGLNPNVAQDDIGKTQIIGNIDENKPDDNPNITQSKPNRNPTETQLKPNDNPTVTQPKPNCEKRESICNKEYVISNRKETLLTECKENRTPAVDDSHDEKPPKKKPVRHKYGQYANVLLSDDDMAKLRTEFPADYEQRIERLSEYMEAKNVYYKSHLATIRMWARNDKARASPSTTRDYSQANATPDNPYGEWLLSAGEGETDNAG